MQAATKSALSNLVEEHVASLVRESAVTNRHSRRGGIVSADDDDDSARDALFGLAAIGGRKKSLPNGTTEEGAAKKRGTGHNGSSSISGPVRRRRRMIHHEDVNMALQWRGSEKLYVSGLPILVPPEADEAGGRGKADATTVAGTAGAGASTAGKGAAGAKGGNNAAKAPSAAALRKAAAAAGTNAVVPLQSTPMDSLAALLANTSSAKDKSSLLPALISSSRVPRVDLNAYLRSETTRVSPVQPPSEIGMTAHWLAVDGVSPRIPMNEIWHDNNDGGAAAAAALEAEDGEEEGDGAEGPRLRARGNGALLHPIEDEEDDPVGGSLSSSSATEIRIRELQRRILSEELRLYFARVTAAIDAPPSSPATNARARKVGEHNHLPEVTAALRGLRTDSGIQELVPFLSRFVGAGLTGRKNLRDPPRCRRLVRAFDAMLDNPNLHLDLHLHQMLTPVGTCVVARKLSMSPFDDHWSLREEAAMCLVKACRIYGDQYTSMKPRIVKLLTTEALSVDRPLPTQFGGIAGVSLLGPRAVDALLLPLAKDYWVRWEAGLVKAAASHNGGGDNRREYELHMCQQALLNALGIFMQHVTVQEQSKRVDIVSFADVFGERLIPLQAEPSDYMTCVL